MNDAATRGLAVEIRLACLAEGNLAILECKKGVIFADANILACEDLGPALTNDDIAGHDHFTCIALHAQVFWI